MSKKLSNDEITEINNLLDQLKSVIEPDAEFYAWGVIENIKQILGL